MGPCAQTRATAPLESLELPDYLRPGLDLVFVGINPGERSARMGRYYAHPTNRFWWALHAAGLVEEPCGPEDDHRLPALGIGLTDLVARASRQAAELGATEFRRGLEELERKLCRHHPRLVCVNGKTALQKALGRTLEWGLQPGRLGGAPYYVAPSPSGRNASCTKEELAAHYRRVGELVERLRGGRA